MNTKKRSRRLMEDLKEKGYRDAYMASSVDVGVAFQIRALREQRRWNQTKLAERANMKQERISILENPSRSPSLSTLKKLANAFDVGLVVRFVPFSDLVKWDINLNSESLNVPSYQDDSFFKVGESTIDAAANVTGYLLDTSGNVLSMEKYLLRKNSSTTDGATKLGDTGSCS